MVNQGSLKLSLWDAFFFSLMVGFGETYLPAFALSLHMPEWVAGIFTTVPLLIGAIAQLTIPPLVSKFKNVRRFVVWTAGLQALSFIPFIYFYFFPETNFIWVFLAAAFYYGMGFASGPSWNYWMSFILKEDHSNQFFSKRHQVLQVGILSGIILGGYLLHFGPGKNSVFGILFAIAFCARISSALAMNFQSQGQLSFQKYYIKDVFKFVENKKQKDLFRFLFFFYISIFISSPFVTPFLLEKLKMSYDAYMWALAALLASKILTQPLAAKILNQWGPHKLLMVGALGISPLPAFWYFGDSLSYAIFLQALSGVFWGFFEVSLAVLFFNQIEVNKKIPVLTVYNCFNAFAIVGGSLIGGYFLKHLDHTFFSYYFIFVLASFLRCMVCLWFFWRSRLI